MTFDDANSRFTELLEETLQRRWDFYPNAASGLGLHQYDGRLPNVAAASLSGRARDLERQIIYTSQALSRFHIRMESHASAHTMY